MRKVLFTTNIPAPYRVDFFNELGKLCDLTVLYERMDSTIREDSWLSSKAKFFKEIYLKGIKLGDSSSLNLSIISWLKKKEFDNIVIGGYSTPSGMLSIEYLTLTNKPFLLDFDGGLISDGSKFMYLLKKHFISKASYYTSTGNSTNNYLIHYGANKAKIFHYPFTSVSELDIVKNPIEAEKKELLKQELGLQADKIIITVGQFIHRKGFDVLIRATKQVSLDTGVYIIGGKPTQEYSDLIKSLSIKNVHFLDFMDKETLRKYYMVCDLFVLPTREDIWGLVINEAMACGLPVVTTDKCVAGLELVENNKNGFIIPTEDDNILAEKMNYILDNKSLQQEMCHNSLRKISDYTIENMAKRYIEIFDEMKA